MYTPHVVISALLTPLWTSSRVFIPFREERGGGAGTAEQGHQEEVLRLFLIKLLKTAKTA